MQTEHVLLCAIHDYCVVYGCTNAIVQEREDVHLTEWDRFARTEYIRLSNEEEGEDASNGSAEVLDDSMEAPF